MEAAGVEPAPHRTHISLSRVWPASNSPGPVSLVGMLELLKVCGAQPWTWRSPQLETPSRLPEPAGFDEGATAWTAERPVWGPCPRR